MKKIALVALIFFVSGNSSVFAADIKKTPSATTATTTSNDNSSGFEWTMEKMLMATAMPMTGEERTFLQTHKNLDTIRDWSFADFKSYVSDDLGKKHVAEEAGHWQGVLKMLKEEAIAQSAKLKELMPDYGGDTSVLDSKAIEQLLQHSASDAELQEIFKLMKSWRKSISILAPYVESMRKKTQPSEQN